MSSKGFTLLEVVIATFIIGTAVAGLFGLFLMTLRSAQVGERRIVAVALANERMEMIRNLPYAAVGTQGGVPAGTIAQEETITRNSQSYTVRTDIRYVDDPYDGGGEAQAEEERVTICHRPGTSAEKTLVVSASALGAHIAHGDTTGACGSPGEGTDEGDQFTADYKQVRVEVRWPSPDQISPVLLITYVAPQGIEGDNLGGTLDFHAFDAAGAPVVGAAVELTNDQVDPAINLATQTNEEGRLVLPGLPAANDSYHLAVTSDGYTTERTYPVTASFIPLPEYSAFSILGKQVTAKTFFIDRVAHLTVKTQDEAGAAVGTVAYRLQGTKIIGHNGSGQAVYKVDETAATDAAGNHTHSALDGDAYMVTIDGAATGYDIKETSEPLPVSLAPAATLDLTVVLAPHTPYSLQVTVVDDAGAPVDNATVTLDGVAQPLATGAWGQVFFSNLSAGSGLHVNVAAPGFVPVQQSVDITGTNRARVVLTPQ